MAKNTRETNDKNSIKNSKDTKDKDRKLSKAELRRKDRFDKLSTELEADGYARKNITVGLLEANLVGPLMALPFIILEIIIFRLTQGSFATVIMAENGFSFNLVAFLIILFALIVIHELIHGISWAIFAENHFRDIEFGVVWKYLTPYCTCAAPLNKKSYIIGGAMPTVILGFGLFAISLFTGSIGLYFLSIIMTLAGCGDMLILYKLIRYKTACQDILVYDHPYEGGSVIFER